MKLSKFKLFHSTPFTNIQNTIFFGTTTERDTFFDNTYDSIETDKEYNFYRNRFTVKFQYSYKELITINYLWFDHAFDGRRYYAYVTDINYINDGVTEISFMIDLVMTYCQNNFFNQLKSQNIEVIRQHYDKVHYLENLERIRNNNDDLEIYTNKLVKRKSKLLENFNVVIHSSADLSGDFGTLEEPKLPISTGATIDRMTSPVNVYTCSYVNFNNLMKKLSGYSWITQNFQKIILVPQNLINEDDLKTVTFETIQFSDLKQFEVYSTSKKYDLSDLNMTNQEILDLLDIAKSELHLVKSNVLKMELTNYKHTLPIDIEKLNFLNTDDFLTFNVNNVSGFENELKVTINNYNSRGVEKGQYLDYSLTLDGFDEVPILINNGNLSKANSAYQRGFANSKTINGRIDRMQNGNVTDKILSGLSLVGDFSGTLSGGLLKSSNMVTNEYDYWREQKATMKTYELAKPTTTQGTFNNSNLMKHNDLGFHLNIYICNSDEFKKHRNYYSLFGFEDNGNRLYAPNSMTVCNWVQFRGNWFDPSIDINSMNLLKAIFENGVRFWNNDGSYNPFKQDISKNTYKE